MSFSLPWLFVKLFEHIIVQKTLLKQNRLVTLCFIFKEFFDVGLLLSSQSFKQLAFANSPLLSTTTTDTIADLLFEPIGARTDVMVETMTG